MPKSFESKVAVLNALGTGKLLKDLEAEERKLNELLTEDAVYRNENRTYLASGDSDCREVKSILAELAMDPPVSQDGKKLTVAEKEAWLQQQRTAHPPLIEAIQHQNRVAFQIETDRIAIESSKRRYDSLKAVLALRTAQIEFLT